MGITTPKLKKIKQTKEEETPLEKLKRLENAKPTEIEEMITDEPEVSELPDYNLPMKGQKTELEYYEKQEIHHKPKTTPKKEDLPVDWEKLQPKKASNLDEKNPLILGKGQQTEIEGEAALKLSYNQGIPDAVIPEPTKLNPIDKPDKVDQKGLHERKEKDDKPRLKPEKGFTEKSGVPNGKEDG